MTVLERTDTITAPLLDSFKVLIQKFIRGSGEEISVEDTLDMFRDEENHLRLWFVYKDSLLCGYAFAETTENIEGSFVIIHQLYMDGVSDRKIYDQMYDEFEKFAKETGATRLICSTRHNPEAFARLIGHGFEVESHILSSSLKRG